MPIGIQFKTNPRIEMFLKCINCRGTSNQFKLKIVIVDTEFQIVFFADSIGLVEAFCQLFDAFYRLVIFRIHPGRYQMVAFYGC